MVEFGRAPRRSRLHPMRLIQGLLAVLVFLSACGGIDPAASAPEIYDDVCARCHGVDFGGVSGPALGPGSDAVDKPDSSLLTSITRGRGRMPTFGDDLTDEQIVEMVDYLRSVQSGE